ncbi:MAG TPA: MerR family DNA-binding transcriptional regulator [Candidatus Cybelea sp.]|nr:MerR family DNA-binding transcriptional regulator [Candidatus Cybelea sp.]
MGDTYTITDLAEEFRVTPRTIRFYEDKNLLHPERQGLNRVYGRRDRARLQLILRGKRLGFSLAAIKEMLDLYDLGDGQVEQLRVTLRRSQERLVELESQRRDINEAIRELKEGIVALEKALADKGVNGHDRTDERAAARVKATV